MNNVIITKTQAVASINVTDTPNDEMFVTAAPKKYSSICDTVTDLYNKSASVLKERGAVIVHERIFGSLSAEPEIMAARKRALEACGIQSDGPITYIEGAPPSGPGLAGVIIRAIVPQNTGDVWTIFDQGVPCGRGWRRNGATYFVLQNIQDRRAGFHRPAPPALQAKTIIERAERILRKQGATYRDVVRTWFYLSGILDWYPEFNEMRNSKYDEFGIMPVEGKDGLQLPASTAVGGMNPRRTAAALDLFAVAGPAGSRPLIRHLTNPGQLEAFHYGSAFSRAVLIREPDATTIQVSGTAAIDERGRSLFPGDARSQIDYALDAIKALLAPEGAGLEDIATATAYVKRPEDASLFREIMAARGFERLPAVCVVADICRDELLFEMDAEVVIEP